MIYFLNNAPLCPKICLTRHNDLLLLGRRSVFFFLRFVVAHLTFQNGSWTFFLRCKQKQNSPIYFTHKCYVNFTKNVSTGFSFFFFFCILFFWWEVLKNTSCSTNLSFSSFLFFLPPPPSFLTFVNSFTYISGQNCYISFSLYQYHHYLGWFRLAKYTH